MQKHAARRLHYDFRLELDGVLLSWAVPKGPSLDPSHRRLAVQTEDHPLEYADFEGMIPEGQYGAGNVLVWDRGRWLPDGDPHEGYRKGRLRFRLDGDKLHGRWNLVRTRDPKSWLLIKSRDEDARSDENDEIVRREPQSVLSGREIDDLGEHDDQVWHSPGHPQQVHLTHPDKILYDEQGLTKRDLANYVMQVAQWMLPHVENRPLTLLRCPEGAHTECFFQKHAMAGMPEQILAVPTREKGGKPADYIAIRDALGLVALVQLGVLEIHTWGARIDRLERPDQLVFDLDPGPGVAWMRVIEAAHTVRERLSRLGLESFCRTTGGKGLHVVVPVQRRHGWELTKRFAHAVADAIVADDPRGFTANLSKNKRRDKIFVDYLRNGRGATAIASYSMRAHPGALVATPVHWDELGPELRSDAFDVVTVPPRLSTLRRDPWAGYFDLRQSITKPMLRALGA